MAVADAVCRLVPGVLSDAACFTDESHWDAYWNILSIPAQRSGMTDEFRPSFSPVTMPTLLNGVENRP